MLVDTINFVGGDQLTQSSHTVIYPCKLVQNGALAVCEDKKEIVSRRRGRLALFLAENNRNTVSGWILAFLT